MLNRPYFSMRMTLRFALAILAGLFLLAGCSSDKKKPEDTKEKKSPQERVVILKQRFAQLDSSLDEMERDLEIQKNRIKATRDLTESLKHSLMKGGLKGYSLGNVSTTDPLVLEAIAKTHDRQQEKELREAKKDESDNSILNGLLIAVFIVFIVIIFMIALKDRKAETPFDTAIVPPSPAADPLDSTPDTSSIAPENSDDTGSFQYGSLRPPDGHQSKPDEQIRPGEEPGQPEDPLR